MRKLFLSLFFACALTAAFSQPMIDLTDVSAHVGDSVRVEGTVFGVKVLSSPASRVLLDIGAAFPAQLLTVAVFPSYKDAKTAMPTAADKGALVYVTGKIELYKGKPQIAVRSSPQLTVVKAETIMVPVKQ